MIQLMNLFHPFFIKATRFQISILLIFANFPALASDFRSPRTDALGGAGHAAPILNDAIYLNPSFASFNTSRSLSLSYLSFGGGVVDTPGGISNFYGNNLNFSVMDGTADSLFQAGVGYTRRHDSSFLHIVASKSFFQRLGVGFGTKFMFPNGTGERITDATASLSGILTNWLQVALIFDNVFQPAPEKGLYREYILGTKLNVMSILFLYLDPHWVPALASSGDAFGYEAGAEFPFFKEIFLRLGAFRSSTVPYQGQRGNGYSAGVGWLAPRISLDYSYSRVLDPLTSFSHNFGFTVFF